MKNKILLSIDNFLSLLFLGGFTFMKVDAIYNQARWFLFDICLGCPFIFPFVLAALSIPLMAKIHSPWKYTPIIINSLTVIIFIGLSWFANNNPDFGFFRHIEEYKAAAQLINNGQISMDDQGFADLPSNLSKIGDSGRAYVSKEGNITTIYFMVDGDTMDGSGSWGYIYRSDGSSPPFSNKSHDDKCREWRELKPPVGSWYYCSSHPVWWFGFRSNSSRSTPATTP